ncbi:hypothetical protein ACHAXR_007629 [Thalassiosira sp. AJA248-18]
MSRNHLKPKSILKKVSAERPPPVLEVMLSNTSSPSCDSSYSSQDESSPASIMNSSRLPHRNASPTRNHFNHDGDDWGSLLRTSAPPPAFLAPNNDAARSEDEQDWELLQKTLAASDLTASPEPSNIPPSAVNPFASPAPILPYPSKDIKTSEQQQLHPKPILRRRLSSSSLTSMNTQKRQQLEVQSIIQTLEDLQHNFVMNDNSTHSSNPQAGVEKEFTIRNFPNGDLFSGNVDAETKDLIYGRMTCALEMEVYEGSFWRGKRHGEGAVCTKMDGGAKFLGRYHEGQMHSGTLIVTRNMPSDFTYTGTFLNNDFHGIGTIVSQDGSIYQGQFSHGQYHGVGTLRTVCEDNDGDGDERGNNNGRRRSGMEIVYIGDFSEGLFEGSGSLTHSDGSSFVGTWSGGKRVEGTETSSNGDVFEGKFLNDIRDGQGILKMKCGGITTQGIWEGDELKEGTDLNITFADGHVYCGDHTNSVPHGFGRMEYADVGSGASIYTGWFVNGFRHGVGRCFFHKTGQEYEGEWACDEPIDLKLFQHNGPLIAGSSGELSLLGEGEDKDNVEMIGCPPTSLNQLHNALSNRNTNNPRSLRSSQSNDLNSSLVSVASSGICSAGTDESIALSSMEREHARATSPNTVPQFKRSNNRFRISTGSSDNLSLSLKSLSVFDFTEGLKLYRYQNGDTFKGRLDKDTKLRQGSGVYTEHRMGSVYNGDWKDSKRHGVGHLKLASGAEYSGEFFDDKIHGQGSLTLIDGSVYTRAPTLTQSCPHVTLKKGSFFNGLFHGRGMLEDEGRGRAYFGEFENGEKSGAGEEKFSDRSRYKGEYKNGKRNGMGVLCDPNGSELYRGGWHEDLRHGKGLLLRHQQEGSSWEGSYEGDFFQDNFSGNGKYSYTDGTSIEGQWLDNYARDGDWSITYPDGSKFYGFATFQHPEEKSVMSDGSSSRGLTAKSREFLRVPLPHGFGSLTFPSGQRFVGSFVHGEYDDGNGKR